MLRIYIGFQAIKFNCFPPPSPPPPHFNCFPTTTTTFLLFFFPPPPPPPPPLFYCFTSTTTTTTFLFFSPTTFLLFSLHHHHRHHRHHISIVFPPPDSVKDYQLPFLVHFVAMSRVVNNNHGFLHFLDRSVTWSAVPRARTSRARAESIARTLKASLLYSS